MRIEVDRNFSILNACNGGVVGFKMPYYTYLMQVAGFDLRYKYSLTSRGIRSHGLRTNIDELIAGGAVTNKYCITSIGSDMMFKYLLTVRDIRLADEVVAYVKSVNIDTLYFTCVIDMVIKEKLSNGNYISLMTESQDILDTVSYMCGEFEFEVFDSCVGALRRLMSGRGYEQ